MATKNRIIKFYVLHQKQWETNITIPAKRVEHVIQFVKDITTNKKRAFDISTKKFCFLESISHDPANKTHSLIFKSARTAYRPNLLDRDNFTERPNPKKSSEGDGERTHLVIKYTDDDVFIVLEKNGRGISIDVIVKYFQKFAKPYVTANGEKIDFSFIKTPLAKENFLDEVNKLSRVTLGQVYVEKSILGSPALNFSNRTQEVKTNIILNIQAERENNISKTIEDIFYKYTANDSIISKMRVVGKSQNNGDVVVDTSFIEKLANVKAELNNLTGVVNTTSIMSELHDIALEL